MEHWGLPPEPSRAPRPAAARQPAPAPGQAAPAAPGGGFGAAFRALVGRKLRELGGRWRDRAERSRRAEAARRAAAEMARRIERQTGHRPAEATIRRNARLDRTPRGVDQARLDRQTRIDQAGGVNAFARQAGVSPRAVPRWRDRGRPLSPRSVRVVADVVGTLWANGEPYPRSLTADVTLDPPEADAVRAAYAVGDWGALADVLGEAITEQVEWAGEAERWFEVEAITDVTVH
ncbi:Uncharacterised protein [Mycobacterium xenopi]|nr:Uncharacterised protein [Mycobacterium xenopi]